MITRTVYLALIICLDIVPIALGQTPQAPSMGGRNMAMPTAEQVTKHDQLALLDQAAAISLHAGRYAEAEAEARQAMALEPIDGVPEEVLAAVLYAQGKDQEALQQYQTVVVHYDRHPRNLLPYALLLLKSGQWAQSLAVCNSDWGPPSSDPDNPVPTISGFSPDVPQPAALAVVLHVALGNMYSYSPDWAGEDQHKEMMAEYQTALQLAPNDPVANYYYGYGWQKLSLAEQAQFGSFQQAKAALQKAARIGKGNVKIAAVKALRVAMKTP